MSEHPCRDVLNLYQEATQAEADLWERIRGRGPGQPGFDRTLWDQWLEAVGRTNAASKALSEAFSQAVSASKPSAPFAGTKGR